MKFFSKKQVFGDVGQYLSYMGHQTNNSPTHKLLYYKYLEHGNN
jgi:hypothetical protein